MKKKHSIDPNTLVLLKQIGFGLIAISLVSLLITAVWHGTRVTALTISDIEVMGGETIDHSVIVNKTSEVLDGNYVGLIPRKFSWLYPKNDIYEVLHSLPRVHNVNVYKESGTELVITFDEYLPHALWCDSGDSANCYFLDQNGYSFAKAPDLSGGAFLRFITLGESAVSDKEYLDKDEFSSLLELSFLLSEQDWYVSYIELDQVGDVFLKIVGEGELKVLATDEPEKVVENLLTVLSSEEFQHIEPGNFKYIDLRFGNKVYVNEDYLNEIVEEVSSSTEDINL